MPVLPENWPAVDLFLACSSQWRFAGQAGVRTGLDYSAVRVVMSELRVKRSPQLFRDVQLMESAALSAWAARSPK